MILILKIIFGVHSNLVFKEHEPFPKFNLEIISSFSFKVTASQTNLFIGKIDTIISLTSSKLHINILPLGYI